ncbi:ATP-binding protein [Streptomyces sp. NPDC093586]|uniref:ATP-binding protein n=1 Tax=Streptomyces sp. NPDC093586 TaxID=3366042 RepID=UPI003811F276
MRPASTPRPPVTARVFTQRFSSTPRGARLARHLALHRLDAWGIPYGSAVSDTAALLVAELAANAVTHGRVPGRDIEVLLRLDAYTLRIDVSDSRGERRPPAPGGAGAASEDAEGGRGLLLVEALADRWGVFDRVPVGKTVRAELDL